MFSCTSHARFDILSNVDIEGKLQLRPIVCSKGDRNGREETTAIACVRSCFYLCSSFLFFSSLMVDPPATSNPSALSACFGDMIFNQVARASFHARLNFTLPNFRKGEVSEVVCWEPFGWNECCELSGATVLFTRFTVSSVFFISRAQFLDGMNVNTHSYELFNRK